MSKRTPTPQQAACIEAIQQHNIIKILAGAGSGKTSVLSMMAEAYPAPSLYLAFNKATAMDATEKFPPHVVCQTTHSRAYAAFGAALKDKLKRPQGKYVNVAGTGGEIGRYFKIEPIEHAREIVLSQAFMGLLVKRTVEKFEQSADTEISEDHIPYGELKEKQRTHTFSMSETKRQLVKYAKKLWKERKDVRSPVLASHDTYLKLFQLSKPVFEGVEVLYVDEYQDTTPCVMDIVLNQVGHMKVVAVGDERQAIYCQPAGTKVRVVKGRYSRTHATGYTDVPIEDVQEGDMTVAYSISKGHLYKAGKRVSKAGSRKFTGQMVTVTCGDSVSKYTEDHHVIVRLGDANVGKQVVYLMQKGGMFRIGIAPWKYGGGMFGAAQRASAEGATAMWLLKVCDSYYDALMQENLISYKYSVPQVCFKDRSAHAGQLNGEDFWYTFGSNWDTGLAVLKAFGLKLSQPLWGCKQEGSMNTTKMRSSFVTSAINLVDGMLCAEMTEQETYDESSHGRLPMEYWKPIKVARENVEDVDVYSLEIEDAHNYFADNILTHNCFRGAVNALQMLDCPTFYLTKSFRYGQAVADVATAVLDRAMVLEGHEAIQSVAGRESVVDRAQPYTRLFRTNAALLEAAIKELRRGTEVAIEVDTKDFVKLLTSAQALKEGNMKGVKHDKVLPFNNWKELLDETPYDGDLGRVSKIVNNGETEKWIDILECHVNADEPHVTFVSAHKSKGRQWPQVVVENDFKSCYNNERDWVGLPVEEQNLLYVSLTRAQFALQYNQTTYEYLMKGQNDTETEEHGGDAIQ